MTLYTTLFIDKTKYRFKMKIKTIIAAVAASLAIVACGSSKPVEGSKEVKALLPSAGQVDSASYLIGINFGSWIKGNNFGELNYSQIVKGIKDFVNSKGTPRDSNFFDQFKVNPEQMNEVLDSYMTKRRDYTSALNKEKADKFFAENKTKEGVDTTASGLQYKIIEAGNDVHPGEKDTVWVNYKGSLLNGEVFDQSQEGNPVKFTLGGVIKGWSEGIQLIGEGGHIELYIPSELGYGEYGSRGIEPNATLIFDVVLEKVGKFVPKEETEPVKPVLKKK